jgi:putative iron-regulated protein
MRCAILFLSLLAMPFVTQTSAKAQTQVGDVLKNYADIAHAGYEDSLITAGILHSAINSFLASPNARTQSASKAAWLAVRVPYQQTEAYRFGNQIVDDWEGKVNAWPLDEGLIDYVDADYGAQPDENSLYVANVIANKSIKIGGRKIDAGRITRKLIAADASSHDCHCPARAEH